MEDLVEACSESSRFSIREAFGINSEVRDCCQMDMMFTT